MQLTKQRRFPLAKIFGTFKPRTASTGRVRARSPFATGKLMLDDLESRVLLAGTPTQLAFFVQPPLQTAAGSAMFPAVQVIVEDAAGLRTTDTSKVFLTIFQGPGGATFNNNASSISVNAVNGIASFTNVVLNTVGTYSILASDGQFNNVTSNNFTITPPAAQVNFSQSFSSLTAGTPFTFNAEIDDAGGVGSTVLSDHSTVTLTIASGPTGATIVGTATGTPVNGIVTFTNISFPKAGTYRLSLKDGTLLGSTSNAFTVTAGAASGLAFAVQPSSTPVSNTITPPVTVDVVDSFGNIITTDNSSMTLTVFSGAPTLAPLAGTTTLNVVNGVATFSDLSIGTAGAYVLQATDGSFQVNSASFNVTGPPTQLVFQRQPSPTTIGQIITPGVQVAVEDSAGHIVLNDTSNVSITISTGPGTLSGTLSVQAINGVATFSDLSLNQLGTYTLAAADGALTGAISGNVTINGLPAQLAFSTQPVNSAAGVPLTGAVRVLIEDSAGNVVVNGASTVTITLPGTLGSLAGTTQVAAVNGVATFSDLIISTAGTFVLDASDGLLTGATSNSFAVTPAASSITFVTQPSNVASKSVMYPAVVVDILDSNSSPVLTNTSAVTLVIVNGPTGATMGGTTTVSAVAGVATFSDLTFTKTGTYTLLAYDGGLVTETSVDFVVGSSATRLAFVNTIPSTIVAGTTLPAFAVKVTAGSANTVTTDHSNVTLAITGPTGATIGGTTTVSTFEGIATFNDIVLTIAGKYTFSVSDGSLTGSSSNSFTVLPNMVKEVSTSNSFLFLNPNHGIITNSSVNTLVGRAIPQIKYVEEDKYGNIFTTLNSGSVTLTITSGPSSTLVGTTTAKIVNGVATFNNLIINTAGSYTILATGMNIVIPDTVPYVTNGTSNVLETVTPVINSMRAPTHAVNYALGGMINLNTQIGSLVAAPANIKYLNGTASETARLVNMAGTTLETGTVSATGAVNFHFNNLALGSYDVYVIYDGDANHTGARSPLFHFGVGNTITTLKVSHLVVSSGGTLVLTATVNNALNSQLLTSGSVQFFEDGNLTPINTATISTGSGHTAVFSLVTSTTGQHSFTASFVANSSLNSSASPFTFVTVA